MSKNISEENIRKAVAQVMHPEIDQSLVNLGMVKDVIVQEEKVTLTLALPFMGIPIKDMLVNSLREAITKLGGEVEVNIADMRQEERDKFMQMAQESWKGME